MPEGLISLGEAAELAGLNPNNHLVAAQQAAFNRVEVVALRGRETRLYAQG